MFSKRYQSLGWGNKFPFLHFFSHSTWVHEYMTAKTGSIINRIMGEIIGLQWNRDFTEFHLKATFVFPVWFVQPILVEFCGSNTPVVIQQSFPILRLCLWMYSSDYNSIILRRFQENRLRCIGGKCCPILCQYMVKISKWGCNIFMIKTIGC